MVMVLWDIGCRNTELRTLKLGNMYSNDFTIKPPKLKHTAPKKIRKGPGILFKKVILSF